MLRIVDVSFVSPAHSLLRNNVTPQLDLLFAYHEVFFLDIRLCFDILFSKAFTILPSLTDHNDFNNNADKHRIHRNAYDLKRNCIIFVFVIIFGFHHDVMRHDIVRQ